MLPLADAMRSAGFNPLLVELPAHGHSRFARSNGVQWSRALFAVSSRHGPWAAAVGHSLGALALAHALSHGLPVRRAALLAVSPPPRLFMRWFAGVLGLPPQLAERMTTQLERQEGADLRGFEPSWLGTRLSQPLLLVHDRDDRVAPLESSETLAAMLPAAELLHTEGLGHRRVLADAAVIQRVSTFVRASAA
jgi:pimeloyl-ACP methyl ester carboxylesterase